MRILLALILTCFASLVSADEYRVTANTLNVRKLPISGYTIVGKVHKGDVLQITISTSDPNWIGVELPNGISGFVSSRYVERIRIDRFNADFLQLLPITPTSRLSEAVGQKHLFGRQHQERFAISSNGRFVIFPRGEEIRIFDTILQRVTRTISTKSYALTNNFLVYHPAVGLLGTFPHLEFIDLRTSDTIQMLDPRTLGESRFIGVAPIPNSDRIVTQVDDGSNVRIVSIDMRRLVIDGVFVSDATDTSGHWGIDFIGVNQETIIGFRRSAALTERRAFAYIITLETDEIKQVDLGLNTISFLRNVVFFSDEGIVIFQGQSKDFSADISLALDYRNGRRLWQKETTGHEEALSVNTTGEFVSYENRFSSDSVELVYDIHTGEIAERRALVQDYGLNNIQWDYASNDGRTHLLIEAGVGISTVETPIVLTVKTHGEEEISFTPPNAHRNMIDILPDGQTLRLLVHSGDNQSYFEWNLNEPEPRVAMPVNPEIRWISEASANGNVAVVYNTDDSYGPELGSTIMSQSELGNELSSREPDNCETQDIYGLNKFSRGYSLASNSGRIANNGNGCYWAWDYEKETLIIRSAPIRSILESERANHLGGCTNSQGCMSNSGTMGINSTSSRLSEDGRIYWADWLGLDTNTYIDIVEYNASEKIAAQVNRFSAESITSWFDRPGESIFSTRPSGYPVASRDGILRLFVSGTRSGEEGRSLWFFQLRQNGTLHSDPIPIQNLPKSIGIVKNAFSNGTNYVVEFTERLVFLGPNFEIIDTQPIISDSSIFNVSGAIGANHFVNALSANIYEIYSLKTGARTATFIVDEYGNALAMTDGGYFAQNRRSAADLLIVRNRDTGEAIPINAVFDTLYRPDLVREALIGDPDNRVGNAERNLTLSSVMVGGGAPVVQALEAETDVVSDAVSARVVVQLKSGGIGNVIWRVNGVTVGVDESYATAFGNNSGQRIEATRLLPLEIGENTISVQVTNFNGTIISERYLAIVNRTSTGELDDPILFVLAVGVDDYEEEGLRLNYSVNDARSIANILSRSGSNYGDVIVTTLFDRDVTLNALGAAFDEISSQIRPSDTFVFFLAGHGVTFDGKYYFLPPNISIEEDPATSLAKYGISQNDWRRFFSQIPALKSLILFDSCESGSAIRMNAANSYEQGAGISRLAEVSGRAIITAAAETQYALEGYEGHGAFTYALLNAFSNGDKNGNDRLDLEELAIYISETLPDLTDDAWQYRQEPQVIIEGYPFDIGEVIKAQ